MLFAELATVSERLAATTQARREGGRCSPTCCGASRRTRSRSPSASSPARPRQGRIGVGWATLRDVRVDPAAEPSLAILEVDRAIDRLAAMSGSGVNAARRALLTDVFARATEPEQQLLWRVLGGELRQGALDGVMVDAVAKAAGVPIAAVRRAHMLSGDLGATAAGRADRRRVDALAAVGMVPGRAVQPMLASPAPDVAAGAGGDRPGVGRVEARRRPDPGPPPRRRGPPLHPQPQRDHRPPRRRSPRSSAGLPGGDLVLDGEALGVDDEGAPRRFQDTMGDFGADAADRPRARPVGVLLRRAPRRRRAGRRRAARRAPRAAGDDRPGRAPGCRRSSPPTPARRRRSSTAPSPPATRA